MNLNPPKKSVKTYNPSMFIIPSSCMLVYQFVLYGFVLYKSIKQKWGSSNSLNHTRQQFENE